MWTLLGGIVLEVFKNFNEKRKTRIEREYHGLLSTLRKAENAGFTEYTDADVDIIEEKIEDFLKAFKNEIREHNREKS